MEAVIFCGIQGSGKSTFYRERFFHTHVRISLDLLKTRHRELLLRMCLEAQQPFVVDNTNPTAEDRRRYVEPASAARFRVVGYYFESRPRDAIARNAARSGRRRIPVPGVLGTYKRLEAPRFEEGFDALHRVRVTPGGGFTVERIGGDSPPRCHSPAQEP